MANPASVDATFKRVHEIGVPLVLLIQIALAFFWSGGIERQVDQNNLTNTRQWEEIRTLREGVTASMITTSRIEAHLQSIQRDVATIAERLNRRSEQERRHEFNRDSK